MTRDDVVEMAGGDWADLEDNMLFLGTSKGEFDDCMVGVANQFGRPPVVAYDYDKMIEVLMKDGMTYEEAVEYFDFNIIGGWVGEYTPVFITYSNCESVSDGGKNA